MNNDTISPIQHIGTESNPNLAEAAPKPKNKGGRPITDKRKKYLSLKQASQHLNIPVDHLKAVKILFPDGFKVNTVIADKVKEFYDANKDKVIELASKGDNFDELKRIKLQNDITLQKLEIAELQGQMVSLEELEQFLGKLGSSVGNLLMSKLVNELPDRINRVDGTQRIVMCKTLYNEIVDKLQNDIDKWFKEHKHKDIRESK